MRFLVGLLLNNALYKGIALLVAFVLWAAVEGAQTEEKGLDLRIELQSLPESLVLTDQSHLEVNVRVMGSRAAIREAERELVSFPLSLEGIKEGETRLPVITESLQGMAPRGARVVARAPSAIVVQAERVVRKKVPVRADVTGEVPEGYVLLGVSVEPSEVILAGARSSIRAVREVLTEPIDVNGLTESAIRPVALAPFHGGLMWRAEEDADPVRVELELEGPPEAGPESDGTLEEDTAEAAE